MTTETNKDLAVIKDEEILRKLWQNTEDFGKKKEIRAQMYKLREERLKNFYDEEIKSSQSNKQSSTSYISEKKQQTSETQSHADALTDHSFMSLKSKEIRDSSSPTKETHDRFKPFLADTSNKITETINEITNDGKTVKHIQSGSISATNAKDNNILSTCSANYQDVKYSSEDGDQNNIVKTQGALRNTFCQQNESGKNDKDGVLESFHTSSTLSSSSSTVVSKTDVGGEIKEVVVADNYQKPVENVTTESYTTPDGTKVTTQILHYKDGTRVSKTKREKTDRKVSNFEISTSSAAKKTEFNEIQEQLANQKTSLIQETITSEKLDTPTAQKNQISNIETSRVSVKGVKNIEKHTNVRDHTESQHRGEINILQDESRFSETSDTGKAVIVINANIQKSSGNAEIVLSKDYRKDTTSEFNSLNDIQNNLVTSSTKTEETNTVTDESSNRLTGKKEATSGFAQIAPTAVGVDLSPQTSVRHTSTKLDQKHNKVTSSEDKKTELIKATEEHADSTYKNDYCINTRISVESSPSHQYFASTLRSVSSDHNKNKSNSLKSSNSSLRSSSSPERKLSPRSREMSPVKSHTVVSKSTTTGGLCHVDSSNKQEKSTLISTHKREQHKTFVGTRKTSRDDTNADFKSRSRSASPAVNTTSDFEFIRINSETADDKSAIEKRYDTRGTSVDNIKKINKIEERSYSSPISRNTPKSPTLEKPILRRKDTYEERCKEILGISQNTTKDTKIEDQKLQLSTKRNYIPNLDNKAKLNFTADFITNLKQAEELDINLQNIGIKKTLQESHLKDKFQVRQSPEKECLSERKLRDELSPKPGKKLPLNKKTLIKEFPSQIRRSPEKEHLPETVLKNMLSPKSDRGSPTKEKKLHISEYPSQLRRSPEKECSPTREPNDKLSSKSDKGSPLKREKLQIKEFPSQVRRSPEREYSPERQLIQKSSQRSDKESLYMQQQQKIEEFPSQIRRSPEKECSPTREPKDKLSSKSDKGSPLKREKLQIKEFPSQVRRSPEREYSPERQLIQKSSQRFDKESLYMQQQQKIEEFPSQIRRSPEKECSPTREPKDKLSSKSDKGSPLKREKLYIKEFPSQVRRSPEREYSPERQLIQKSSQRSDKESLYMQQQQKIEEFPSQIRRSPEKECSPTREPKDKLSSKSDKGSPLKREKLYIKEFPSQARISPEKEYSPERQLIQKLSLKSDKESSYMQKQQQIEDFPSQIRRSPEKECSPTRKPKDKLSSKSDRSSPLKQEKLQIKEFPSQVRRSPEREYSPERQLIQKSSQRFDKESLYMQQQQKIEEFPSQIRRSPEKECSPTREPKDKLSSKSDKGSPLKREKLYIKEFPSQARISPEKEYSPERQLIQKLSLKSDKESSYMQKQQQIEDFPSQIRRSPEKECSPTRKPKDKLSSKSDRSSPLKQEKLQIKEFPSQVRRSPEKQYSPERQLIQKSSPKSDKRSSYIQKPQVQIKEFSSQMRRSPDREYSSEDELKDKTSPKSEHPSLKQEKLQIKEFPSQTRKSSEKEFSPTRAPNDTSSPKPERSALKQEKVEISVRQSPERNYSSEINFLDEKSLKPDKDSPLKKKKLEINEFPSQIISSNKDHAPDRLPKENLNSKSDKHSPLKQKTLQMKGLFSSPQLQQKTIKKEINLEIQEFPSQVRPFPAEKCSLKVESVDKSSTKLNKKTPLKQKELQINEFPSQIRQPLKEKQNEKSSLKFDQTINLSSLDMKLDSQSRKFSHKVDNEKTNETCHKPENESAKVVSLNERLLQKQLMPINNEPVHYKESNHKTVKKDKPIGLPYSKQLKSNNATNKEDELIKVSLDRINYKNMKPVNEPKAVKKFVSLLCEEEENDKKNIRKSSSRNKTINELESEMTEKNKVAGRKTESAKVVTINRADIKKDVPKKRFDSNLNKVETSIKVTVKPKQKVTLVNASAKSETATKTQNRDDTVKKTSSQTNAPRRIEKVTKIVSIPPFSIKTKPTTITNVEDKTNANLPRKQSEKITRHVVTAILPVPPVGKEYQAKSKDKTITLKTESKPKTYTNDERISKVNCLTTKSVMVNADLDNEKEVVIKLQRSKSSREPTPDRPSAFPCDDDGEIPRYPDQICEPDDSRCRSEPVNLSEIIIHESEEMIGDNKVQELTEDVSHKTKINKYDDEDECLLSVNEKVSKFVNEAKKLISPSLKSESSTVHHQVRAELSLTNQETSTLSSTLKKADQSPREQVITTNTNGNEIFATPKSSRKNFFSEESKSILSNTGRLRSNESIRKAKQIFENIEQNKSNSIIREQDALKAVATKGSSLFHKEETTSISEDSLDNIQNRSSHTISEKNTSDFMKPLHCLRHSSPTSEKKTTSSTHHSRDSDRITQKSSNVINENRKVIYSKESPLIEKTDVTKELQVETVKTSFDTSKPKSKQEKLKSINVPKTVSSNKSTDLSTFKAAVRKFSGENKHVLTVSEKDARIDVENIYDIELLETLLEKTTDYNLRSRIRAQIRILKRNDSENRQNFTKVVKDSSVTNETSTNKNLSNYKEKTVKTSCNFYDSSEPKESRESHEFIYETKTEKFTPAENPQETTEQTSKKSTFTRKGSVKEISKKFIDNAIQTSKGEKTSSYPRAGLILRTTSFNDSKTSGSIANEFLANEKSNFEENSSKTFLTSKTKVTGVRDIINRIKNAENDALDRKDEDAEARALLNKFLGCQVLLTGLESSLTSSESRITTINKTINKEGKTIFVKLNFRHPISEEDLYDIWDVDVLQLLLEKCTHFEEQQVVKARLDLVMAEQEERKTEATEQEVDKENKEEETTVDKKVEFNNVSEDKTVSETDEKKSEENENKSPENDQEDGQKPVASATRSRTLPTKTPVSPFAKFRQLDKQGSGSTPSTPNTPTGSRPLFKFTDPDVSKKASTITARLLQWVQMKTKEYENISIDNFSSSWADGLAFCALIHHFLPDAFDYSALTPKNRRHNFTLAFTVAEEKADIYPLLDVEDMVMMKKPDWKCVFTYVQAIYRRFKDED